MPKRWNKSAILRKKQIESGIDITFSEVFIPWYKRKLETLDVSCVLEVGSGTGHLASQLSGYCKNYIAIEPSEDMYNISQEVLKQTSVKLHQSIIQSYKPDIKFSSVIAHMCLHTIEDLQDAFICIDRLLKKQGTLLVALPHPCFYNDYKKFFSKKEYNYVNNSFKEVSFSITNDQERVISGVPYYHRPLSYYFSMLNRTGIYTINIHEMFPSKDIMSKYNKPWKTPHYIIFEAKKIS